MEIFIIKIIIVKSIFINQLMHQEMQKGYFFKLTDNILKSVNLSQLENIIKNYEYMQFIKIF